MYMIASKTQCHEATVYFFFFERYTLELTFESSLFRVNLNFSGGSVHKESACNSRRDLVRCLGQEDFLGKDIASHGQKKLTGYSP